MGRYLDGLVAEFDEINEGIDEILDRAADESRDVTTEEKTVVERSQGRAEELKKAIEDFGKQEELRSKVAAVRGRVGTSVQRSTTVVVNEREKDPDVVLREAFPTAGDYLVTAGRALRGDKAALELIERATAHQTTDLNPGLLPRPIVGPLITAVSNDRPFISSIPNKLLPINQFDRPVITQHVGVGKQAKEKDETESRPLKVDKLPVTAATYAGHLNVSKQDIRWSTPGLMQLIAEDFVHEYARESDTDAVAQFEASLTNDPIVITSLDAAGVTAAIFAAAATAMSTKDGAPLPDTLWVAPDVWGAFGSIVNNNGVLVFPSVTPTSSAGNLLGIRLVVDSAFTPGTATIGVARYLEWFEQIEGLLQVEEPNVLGQLVGYAGYGAFLNTMPDLFTPLTLPVAEVAAAKTSSSK